MERRLGHNVSWWWFTSNASIFHVCFPSDLHPHRGFFGHLYSPSLSLTPNFFPKVLSILLSLLLPFLPFSILFYLLNVITFLLSICSLNLFFGFICLIWFWVFGICCNFISFILIANKMRGKKKKKPKFGFCIKAFF